MDEKRAEAMRQLLTEVKRRKIRYADIAWRSGNTPGWVGHVLRGGMTVYGANRLSMAMRLALESQGLNVPGCLVTF